MSSAAHDAIETRATMKRRNKHRRAKVWFMKSAAWAFNKSYHLPITDEGMRHFMWGADCAIGGQIVITDIDALLSGHLPNLTIQLSPPGGKHARS